MNLKDFLRRLPIATLFAAGVVLLAGASQANAQAVISGRVVDADGVPVAFAEISIERLNVGTVAGADGSYRLLVPAARVTGQREMVVARALGFRSETLEVGLSEGEISLDFTLMLDPLKLEGVVATGQALTNTRERLGYTVDTVDSDEIVQSEESNIVSALAGKAPGVWVTSSTGDPGGGAFINIRGWKTNLDSNQPLFVVDGTPVDNSTFCTEGGFCYQGGTTFQNRVADLNPDDVESVEILKGPAATSIYGSAGANGVVLITTKSGQRGVARFTAKTSYTWDQVDADVPLQTQYGRGRDGAAVGQPGVNLSPADDYPYSWGPVLGSDVPVYDHWGELFRTGNRASLDMTLSGGGDRTTYYLSGSYLNHQGPLVGNNSLDKWSVRLKATQWVRDNLSVSGNFAYTSQAGDMVQQGSNVSGLLLASLRTVPEFNNLPYIDPETGLHRAYRNPHPTSLTESRIFDNPFWVANEILNKSDVGRTFGNIRADWQALDWLNASWLVGADYANDDRFTLFPKSSSAYVDGAVFRFTARTFDIDNTLLLTADHTVNENVSGSVTLGYNMRQQETTTNRNQGTNLIYGADELDFAADRVPNEFKSTVRSDGYFGELNVDLYDQLFLSGRLRNEGWSTFGPETDSRFWYGSASASWTFTKALSLDPDHWLSFGKVRLGYGSAGRAPNAFMNLSSFTAPTLGDGWYTWGLETLYMGLEGVTFEFAGANEEIQPERTTEFEAGVEVAFLDSRVSLTGTYYSDRTKDAILNVPLPSSTGFGSVPLNGAEFSNKGWEFTLDMIPVRSQKFSWEVGAQWSTNKSKVEDILGAEYIGIGFGFTSAATIIPSPEYCAESNISADDCAFGLIRGRDFVRFGRGIEVDGVDIDEAYPDAPIGAVYVGDDGFPIQDPTLRIIGDPNPDWLASIRNTFRLYDNLRVSFLLDVKRGGDTWNGTKGALVHYGTHAATLPWHGEGTPHTFEGYGPGAGTEVTLTWDTWGMATGSGFNGPSSQFVENSGYTKLRDVSVTYAFDQPWVNRLGFNTIEVTLSGRNLKTWTDYTGIDPETNLAGQTIGRGLDYFNHPQTRSFILTFNFVR